MTTDGGGRLGRWARRKAEAKRRGGAAPAVPETPAEVSVAAPEPLTQGPLEQADEPAKAAPRPASDVPTEAAAELDLPDIETLNADSDFSVFMKEGVPAQLRRLALRKLWASDPLFNHIDVMVEYGEDYTDAAMVVEGLKSSWEVGRGYARADEKDAAAEGRQPPGGSDPAEQDERVAVADAGEEEPGTAAEIDPDPADTPSAPSEDDGEEGLG